MHSDHKSDPCVVYGIKNCDTVKKARAWLQAHGVEYRFHDLRTDGLEPERLQAWEAAVGWERLLNKSGTTFRKLPEERKTGLDRERALALLLEQPTLIRRPVVEAGGRILVGFKEAEFATLTEANA